MRCSNAARRECAGSWFCDVVRVLDALDEERSTARIGTADNGGKIYVFGLEARLVFRESAIRDDQRAFRMKYREFTVVCDQDLMKACKAAKLSGISFYPAEWSTAMLRSRGLLTGEQA